MIFLCCKKCINIDIFYQKIMWFAQENGALKGKHNNAVDMLSPTGQMKFNALRSIRENAVVWEKDYK